MSVHGSHVYMNSHVAALLVCLLWMCFSVHRDLWRSCVHCSSKRPAIGSYVDCNQFHHELRLNVWLYSYVEACVCGHQLCIKCYTQQKLIWDNCRWSASGLNLTLCEWMVQFSLHSSGPAWPVWLFANIYLVFTIMVIIDQVKMLCSVYHCSRKIVYR